jgi:uncharacterized small protein (DUF1192 family)
MQEDTKRTATGYSDESATSRKIEQRLTVHEATSLLGMSVVRFVKRPNVAALTKEKSPDGTVYIVLNSAHPPTRYATSHRTTQDETTAGLNLLVSSLEDQIACLQSELETRNEELRYKDYVLAAALERVPQVKLAPDISRPLASRSDTMKKGDDIRQEPATRHRSWLVRFFSLGRSMLLEGGLRCPRFVLAC